MSLTQPIRGAYNLQRCFALLLDLPEDEQYPQRLNLYNLLLESRLLVSVEGYFSEPDAEGQPRAQFAFTHREAFEAWANSPETDAVYRCFTDICRDVAGQHLDKLTLNDAGPYAFSIGLSDVLYLQHGLLPPPRIGL